MKDGLVLTIANHMKKCFLNWNKDTVEDDVIFQHLFELSDGKLNMKDSKEVLSASSELLKSKKRYTSNNGKKSKKGGRSGGRKRY
jgi:hypothetical protein